MMKRLAWAVVTLAMFSSCKPKSEGAAPLVRKPHAPVTGPALWRVNIEQVTLQTLDENDQPVGQPHPVSVRTNSVDQCRLEKDPGNEPIDTWFAVRRGDGMSMSAGQDPAVAEDIVYCAKSSVINLPDVRSSKGSYRAMVRVYFSDPDAR